MQIVKIISEHKKKNKLKPIKKGCKRVEAIVKIGNKLYTQHIDVPK